MKRGRERERKERFWVSVKKTFYLFVAKIWMKIFVRNPRQLRHNDDGDAGEKTFSTFVYLRSCVLWSAYNPNINMCWVCVYVLMEERRLLIFKHCTQTVANYMFENICRHTTPLKHLLTHAHSPMHTLSHSHTQALLAISFLYFKKGLSQTQCNRPSVCYSNNYSMQKISFNTVQVGKHGPDGGELKKFEQGEKCL